MPRRRQSFFNTVGVKVEGSQVSSVTAAWHAEPKLICSSLLMYTMTASKQEDLRMRTLQMRKGKDTIHL